MKIKSNNKTFLRIKITKLKRFKTQKSLFGNKWPRWETSNRIRSTSKILWMMQSKWSLIQKKKTIMRARWTKLVNKNSWQYNIQWKVPWQMLTKQDMGIKWTIKFQSDPLVQTTILRILHSINLLNSSLVISEPSKDF